MIRNDPQRTRTAWCLYDWANSAFATTILAAVLPVYFVALVPPEGARIALFGLERTIPAGALWGYIVALATATVALAAPWLGILADRRRWRQRLLVVFGSLGAVTTALLCLAGPGDYALAALLFIVAEIGFAVGNIFYDSFLPTLAGNEAELDRLSARGYAFGYLGGGLALLLAFVLIQWPHVFGLAGRATATRAAFLLTGLWWAIFALPAFISLKERLFSAAPAASPVGSLRDYLRIFGEMRRHPDLLFFLLAFLFYNDGIQTIITVSAIFGREELGLSQTSIMMVFLMIQFVAFPGALLYGRIAARWGAKRALLLGLILFIAITVYAYTMRQPWQFWLLGGCVALVYGGCQAISRSLYASFIPAGKSAEFFAFFTVSGKFASLFGPLIFALIADLTGSTRLSILALSILFILGLFLLLGVDVQRGQALARTESA